MKKFFSKRHEDALASGKLKPSFTRACRISILRILSQHSEWLGYDEHNKTFSSTEETLKTFYGKHELEAWDENNHYKPADLSKMITSGRPAHVLDTIEAWFEHCIVEEEAKCEKELNDILIIHNSPWQIVNRNALLVDSEYLHNEVRSKAISLMEECGATGALEEFEEALQDYQTGEIKDAIVNAHKSVESTMKSVLEIENVNFGGLLGKLIKSGIIPDYYEDFFKQFEQLALGAVKERNQPGRGHGQGKEVKTVPPSLAEFALNLAGSINVFIIKHHLEKMKENDLDIPF